MLERANAVNVVKCVIPGGDLRESAAALRLCNRFPGKLMCGVGVHAHYAEDPFRKQSHLKTVEAIDLKYEIREMVASAMEDDGNDAMDSDNDGSNTDNNNGNDGMNSKKAQFAFIGECGLDYNRMFSAKHIQLSIFEQQIQIAIELNLPLFCHERDAHNDFIALINKYSHCIKENEKRLPVPILVHCFHGDRSELIKYVQMGCYIGVTTVLCIEARSLALRQCIGDGLLPIENLIIETDTPYMPPKMNSDNNGNYHKLKPFLQTKNEPCLLPCLINCLYNCYRQRYTRKQICEITTRNATEFFERRYAVKKPLLLAKRHNASHRLIE